MPTQLEVDYWRDRKQRLNFDKFYIANALALVTHSLLQPLDLIKIRSMKLQEGRTFMGLGFQRGYHPFQVGQEIMNAGGGFRKFWTSLDGFLLRTLAFTTGRIACFGYFYDWLNSDPRRQARPDAYAAAGLLGGLTLGILTNPVDIVFTRMQADEMYDPRMRYNYKNFIDGLIRTSQEGALMRGAVFNGLRHGGVLAVVTPVYDWVKEQFWYIYGPTELFRLVSCLVASILATAIAHPFDSMRTRMHTMRALPNGQMPYRDSLDALLKFYSYESQIRFNSNGGGLYAGCYAACIRTFGIAYVSMRVLDHYFDSTPHQEFWQPQRFNFQGGIDFDIHEPFTLAYHKRLAFSNLKETWTEGALRPGGNGGIKTV